MQNFYKRYIAPPSHPAGENRIFSPEHLMISTVLIVFIAVILHIQIRKKDPVFSRKLLVILAGTMLGLEVFRITWMTVYYGFDLRNIRFDWCNQICLALPVIVLLNARRLYPYIDILAFMGGTAVLLYPLWVFYDYGGIHIMSLQSMLSHSLMVLIAMSLPFSCDYRPQLKDAHKAMAGFSVIAVIAFIMSGLLDVNYLLMKNADGVPLLQHMDFPWYWIIGIPLLYGLIVVVTLALDRFYSRIAGIQPAESSSYKFQH